MTYLLLAILGSAAMTLVMKTFRAQKGNRFGIILGNYVTCVALALIMLPQKAALFSASPVTIACGLLGGALYVCGILSMQTSIRVNGAILTAVFAKLGLLVSLALSILWFGERPGWIQVIGIVLVFAAMPFINAQGAQDDKHNGAASSRSFLLLLITLLACGSNDAMAKVFEALGSRSEDTLFFFFLFLTAAVLSALLAVVEWRRTGKKLLWQELAAGVAVGVPNYFSSYLLLKSLVALPAFLVYPSFSTGAILVVMAASFLLFKERPSKRQMIGICIILAALVLLNL